MSKLPQERSGAILLVNGARVQFSFWPTTKRAKSYVRQVEILTNNPWDIIEHTIKNKFPDRDERGDRCHAFLQQARDFYVASQNQFLASRPLLLYYSFLNLAKSLIIYSGLSEDLDRAIHGISEPPLEENQREFFDAQVKAQANTGTQSRIFDLFSQAIGTRRLSSTESYSVVSELAPQIVIGHRLWALAARKPERFVRCQEVAFLWNRAQKEIWTRIKIDRADFRELAISHSEFLRQTSLKGKFREVRPESTKQFRQYVTLELATGHRYTRRPSDILHELAKEIAPLVWPIIRSSPPYRRYYLYASPESEHRLHHLSSVYAVVFYLGSVTRYRPHCFDVIRKSPYGMLIDEIVTTQGPQFLYQVASVFATRDVSMAAVI